MTERTSGVLAQYDSLHGTEQAIRSLREAGYEEMEIFSPFPAPELEEAMDIHDSPVRRFALGGGITGFFFAIFLTVGTSLAYPLVQQGKPLVSWPPFIVIMFELTILFTGISAFLSMLFLSKRPKKDLSPHYRAAFSVDRFGIFVPAGAGERDAAERAVRSTGPVEVEVEA